MTTGSNHNYLLRIKTLEDVNLLPQKMEDRFIRFCVLDVFELLKTQKDINLLDIAKSFNVILNKSQDYFRASLNEYISDKVLKWVKENYHLSESIVGKDEQTGFPGYPLKEKLLSLASLLGTDNAKDFLLSRIDQETNVDTINSILKYKLSNLRQRRGSRVKPIDPKVQKISMVVNSFLVKNYPNEELLTDPLRIIEYDLFYQVGFGSKEYILTHPEKRPGLIGGGGSALVSKTTTDIDVWNSMFIHGIKPLNDFELKIIRKKGKWQLMVELEDYSLKSIAETIDLSSENISESVNEENQLILEEILGNVFSLNEIIECKAKLNEAKINSKLDFRIY